MFSFCSVFNSHIRQGKKTIKDYKRDGIVIEAYELSCLGITQL